MRGAGFDPVRICTVTSKWLVSVRPTASPQVPRVRLSLEEINNVG